MNFEDLYNNLPPIKKYNQVLDDIKRYNRADTVNMTEEEMNKFRHIAGPAYMTSEYYSAPFVRLLGAGKEVKDLLQGRKLPDTKFDMQNNELGLEYGNSYRKDLKSKIPQKSLFDYIFETEIKPYRGQQ